MGNQPLPISDVSVSPQHASIKRIDEEFYQITDMDSAKGVTVFGLRIKRKTIKENTPIHLGTYKTSVEQLLHNPHDVDLTEIWKAYDKQKRVWDRYSTLVNSIRMLSPILTMLITQVVGQNWMVSCGVLLFVMIVAMVAGEKVLTKKSLKMAELNTNLQRTYLCPHCQKFLGFVPYDILKRQSYCPNPNCGVPLP